MTHTGCTYHYRVFWSLLAMLLCAGLLGQKRLIVEVKTDEFSHETSWQLSNANNFNILIESSDDLKKETVYSDTIFVDESDCFQFEISDSGGDGFAPGAYFKILFDDVVVADNSFGDESFSLFFNCSEAQSCNEAKGINAGRYELSDQANSWFEILPNSNTFYNIEASICDASLWIYDECDFVHPTDQTGAVFYLSSEDERGGLYRILLEGSKKYYLRVGRDMGCMDHGSLFIEELEDKLGCMDSNACNFDPFANVSDNSCYYSLDCKPDLTINQQTLISSLVLDSLNNSDECLLREGCVTGYGVRDIIRFSTEIENIGTADYIIGQPEELSPLFSEENCHDHWHYLGYAEYLLFDGSGSLQPVGFKNGFCALDSKCSSEESYKYNCDYMGISAGCSDTYKWNVQCQWIDVTDVPDGRYTLVVRVNYTQSPDLFGRQEASYQNNWAQVCLNLDRSSGALTFDVLQSCEPYTDCMGVVNGAARLDCNNVCGGIGHFGDLNQDGELATNDVALLSELIHEGTISYSSCMDADGDGHISLYDALILRDCNTFSESIEDRVGHIHCDFPRSYHSVIDTIWLSILESPVEPNAIDLFFRSTSDISAMEMSIQGLQIERLHTHINEESWAHNSTNIFFDSEGGENISKSTESTFLLRIYGDLLSDNVCIDEKNIFVAKALTKLNLRFENKTCLNFQTTAVHSEEEKEGVLILPNPVANLVDIVLDNTRNNKKITLFNGDGVNILTKESMLSNTVQFDLTNLPIGVYYFAIESKKQIIIRKVIRN